MGLNYAFDLFLPDAALPTLLLELRALLDWSDAQNGGPPAAVRSLVLVDDWRVHLPCTAEQTTGLTIRLERDVRSSELDLALCFERDPALDACDIYTPGQPMARVGSIYTTIWRGAVTSRASFTAATSWMSRLFETSPSIQQTFVTLARRCSAELVALDLEDGRFDILDDPPRRRVEIDRDRWDGEDSDFGDLDPATLLVAIREARLV